MQGILITFEGPDGGGKTTQVKLLSQYLQQHGHEVLCTREPGGTELGDRIRELLLDTQYSKMSAQTEALLYMAARAQHVFEKIKPALVAGKVVISDRYADSTIVYQGVARRLSAKELLGLNQFATGGLKPDLTLLLDGGVTDLLARAVQRGKADRIESEGLVFQQRVREGFLALAQKEPERIKTVAAGGTIDDIHQQIVKIILEFFNGRSHCEN